IEAVVVDVNNIPLAERPKLLDLSRLPAKIMIRNWRAGDRYWPAHTKEPKKVKELLSDHHISGTEKKLWTVAVAEGVGVVWMRSFPTPADLQPVSRASQALWFREVSVATTSS